MDKLEVSNKSLVKVHVRSQPHSADDGDGSMRPAASSGNSSARSGQQSVYKYFFNIGSVDSFERNMEEAQEALGISLGDEVAI